MTDLAKGILLLLVGTFLFACMDVAAKAMTQHYHPLMVVWARYTVPALLTLLIFLPSLKARMQTQRLGIQIIRSGLLFVATMMFFSGFSLMPLSSVMAVAQVAPLMITGLAALLLGERVGLHRGLSVIIGLVGALVILRPGFGETGIEGLLPLLGALAFAAYSIATRFLGSEDSVWTTFIYTALVGAVVASLMVPWFWSMPSPEHLPIFATMGIIGALGQLALIFAFKLAPASVLAPFFYSSMIWAAGFGFIFFDERPDHWTIVGATTIVAAGLYVRYRESRLGLA